MNDNQQESETKGNNLGVLKPREQLFITKYLEGLNAKEAYLFISPNAADSTARVQGSVYLKRIKAKAKWSQLLEENGLDDFALIRSIKEMLNARTTKFYMDTIVCTLKDNATRMKATELLADLRGKRKGQIDLYVDLPIPATVVIEVEKQKDPDSEG